MIVVDTNVIAYLLIDGATTEQARSAFLKDPEWAAPVLWRSEFLSVLSGYLRQGALATSDALALAREAWSLMEGAECAADPERVLGLVARSSCSSYDCEFVALAEELGVPLVTTDTAVLAAFPEVAVRVDAFVGRDLHLQGTPG